MSGVDVDARLVEGLAAGRSRIEDVAPGRLAALEGRFRATPDHAALADFRGATRGLDAAHLSRR